MNLGVVVVVVGGGNGDGCVMVLNYKRYNHLYHLNSTQPAEVHIVLSLLEESCNRTQYSTVQCTVNIYKWRSVASGQLPYMDMFAWEIPVQKGEGGGRGGCKDYDSKQKAGILYVLCCAPFLTFCRGY